MARGRTAGWRRDPRDGVAVRDRCGRGAGALRPEVLLVQHYESLYHGQAETVDATYRLPLKKIVISTWLRDIMRERFASDAEILVTPVDPMLFHAVSVTVATSRPRVLMLHHDYAWKGTAEGFEVVARVKQRVPGSSSSDSVSARPGARRATTSFTPTRRKTRSPPSTAAARSTCALRGTRASACRRWRRWPAAPRS